jgi:phosphoglycerate dehydrogenase-like enzyme/glyoxylase-like metal-dependent hydrolase (beta-lactamase superfamily II)
MRAVLSALFVVAVAGSCPAADLPKMKFDEVKEVAPGVFFRYSSIGPGVPFGGSNNIWVVFKDYVVVIDANFPKEAGDVLAAVRKTTKKPVRYVLDTHHHGDHAFGNAVWTKAGATVVAQANCGRLMCVTGPRAFAEAGRAPKGRPDIAASSLAVPGIVFDDKYVLDDGKQRVEFLFFGHAHTPGDAFAYLPKHKILCTGDACVNGAFNFMGHSDSASWIRALERAQKLDVKLICPGHGELAHKDLLERQKRHFVGLREAVAAGLKADKDLADIAKDYKPAWYKEWTGVDVKFDNVEHVYNEMTGRLSPPDLTDDYALHEGPSPTKDSPGWTKPKRIVVPAGLMPARLAQLKRVAPEVEFLPARSPEAAAKLAADADAVVGFDTPGLIEEAGKKLRWVQARGTAEKDVLAAVKKRKAVLTDARRFHGSPVVEETFVLIGRLLPDGLHKKNVLVVGLGDSGVRIARRAQRLGARVTALDSGGVARPPFVDRLDKFDRLDERLKEADVVVLARPLTKESRGMIGEKQLKAMKRTAYLINAAHSELVDWKMLAWAAGEGWFAGAGLDVTDVGMPAADHPLRKSKRVVLSVAVGKPSPQARDREWRLWRENVRRFAAGEPLLGVVDLANGG